MEQGPSEIMAMVSPLPTAAGKVAAYEGRSQYRCGIWHGEARTLALTTEPGLKV